MCIRMDKGRLPIVLKALEAIEDAEPEVATTLSGHTDNFASSLYGEFKRDDQVGQRTFSTNPWRYTPQVNTHSKDLDELKLSEKCFK